MTGLSQERRYSGMVRAQLLNEALDRLEAAEARAATAEQEAEKRLDALIDVRRKRDEWQDKAIALQAKVDAALALLKCPSVEFPGLTFQQLRDALTPPKAEPGLPARRSPLPDLQLARARSSGDGRTGLRDVRNRLCRSDQGRTRDG